MATSQNAFLDVSGSSESDNEQGYDSEAAEQTKGGRSAITSQRAPKRRKLSPVESQEKDDDDDVPTLNDIERSSRFDLEEEEPTFERTEISQRRTASEAHPTEPISNPTHSSSTQKVDLKTKKKKPGVVYLSSLPPYLRPSALRNLLTQRGFSPITRLFFAPATKSKSSTHKRQLYTEGWVEFASRGTAKRCAETLNAQLIGGKKGGFYHDDLWSMKYLRGMGWEELMAGVREERREEEGRRDEERLVLARETRRLVEGVERGREEDTRRRKMARKKDEGLEDTGDVKRTWRQFEPKGKNRDRDTDVETAGVSKERVNEDVKRVLGKIF